MDMLTPAGVIGISLALFGPVLLYLGAGIAIAGLLMWFAIARAEDGKARLCASRGPALLVGLLAGFAILAGQLGATQASFASLNGVLDWVVFLVPGAGAALGAALLSWPGFALLRPSRGRAQQAAIEGDGLRHV